MSLGVSWAVAADARPIRHATLSASLRAPGLIAEPPLAQPQEPCRRPPEHGPLGRGGQAQIAAILNIRADVADPFPVFGDLAGEACGVAGGEDQLLRLDPVLGGR